eukprot:TRINITY_DN15977_c0_g1_i2.p1 TRINITY_DN15977_c0_g1~~TRINITY_DN15977_c0_g1_i2.p1  ORF type:complete len:702 (+),score=285.05 TRINITY_DN15977_c0_g1_i2:81-2108(+)
MVDASVSDGLRFTSLGSLVLACVATLAVSLLTIGAYYCFVLRPRLGRIARKSEAAQRRRERKAAQQGGAIDTAVYSLKTRKKVEPAAAEEDEAPPTPRGELRVLYATLKGAAEEVARRVAGELSRDGWAATATSLADLDPDAGLSHGGTVLLVLPTYEQGLPPPAGRPFAEWLRQREQQGSDRDFAPLTALRFGVFGLGHSDYEHFNTVAKETEEKLRRLCAKPLGQAGLYLSDDAKGGAEAGVGEWLAMLRAALKGGAQQQQRGCGSGGAESSSETDGDVGDLEDLAGGHPAAATAEMINPRMRRALEKQGYKLLGSHSGVKLCRWTQNQLRGRGGCYKHTFYGIVSYRCMEMTPSLACANKCVFCWRHHTNPVTTSWKWKHDSPEFLIEQAVEGQRSLIKPLKGVPGVDPARYADAMNPRHCALSLVGEPIIYPEINNLLRLMHKRGISSFLVTNAQFPDQMETLDPVTQLYISIDAATRDTLKAVDRPIFEDFWERFLSCVDGMRRKGQRTVFRLTLVKSWNATEVEEYAHLVQRGQPDFVEVKGVTWCGESTASNLTMSNVPFHQEVVRFCEELSRACGDQYAIACEHEHSCCILIAHTRFRKAGSWHTWIDFDRFGELVGAGRRDFTSDDYLVETPDWAQYGNAARGFDPDEKRFVKVRNHPGQAAASAS